MKNFYHQYKKEILFFAGCAVFILIVILSFSTCDKTVQIGPTSAEIKQEVKEAVQPADHKIDSLEKERKELVKVAKSLSEKLLLAQYENKRLRAKVSNSIPLGELKIEPSSNDGYNPQDNTDLVEITTAAAASDSICNEVIANLQDQLINSDSVSFQKDIKIAAYKTGFEKMGEVVTAREYDIKQLNKKLKWQKVQNIGLKAVIIGAAALIIKNSL